MAIPGQASGDFTESQSALRILYIGHRNTFSATLTTDSFIQTNPPVVVTPASVSQTLGPAPKRGVLSGSVAFTRPDAGNGFIGGPLATAPAAGALRPLGFFINDAAGYSFLNTPAAASGQGPYTSAQGTIGTQLYETQNLNTNAALTYQVGDFVYASLNGYLTNVADADNAIELAHALASATVMGVVKIVPDAVLAELLLDQRI
jgi:hypothetical protein